MKAPCFDPERLFAYANHMLGAREEAAVKTHLHSCGACREIAASFDRVNQVLDEWKPAEPSPWFDARTRARIAAGAGALRRVPLFSGKVWAGLAAAVAVAVVAASLTVWRPSHSASSHIAASLLVATVHRPATAPVATIRNAAAPSKIARRPDTASQEIALYENLNVLENYDMLANFDVLSELPQARDKATD
ncbi:MAG: zf-HC2 domain-containing protein [Terriglobia bacterium]